MRRIFLVPIAIGIGVLAGSQSCRRGEDPYLPNHPEDDCGDFENGRGGAGGGRLAPGLGPVRAQPGPFVPPGATEPFVPPEDPEPNVPPGGPAPDPPQAPDCSWLASGTSIHSPITEEVKRRLLTIAAGGEELQFEVFAKIGDSHSVGTAFMQCFDVPDFDLGEFDHLRPTLEHFTNDLAGGVSSFSRDSIATVAGIGSSGLNREDQSLIRSEVEAIYPRFAVVMAGTNDAPYRSHGAYAADMIRIVDWFSAAGVIPLLSTVPPLSDPDMHRVVLRYNGMLRAISASRGLPLVDLHVTLLELPDWGLRGDGVHLSVDWNRGGGWAACRLVDDGLDFGANRRNLATLEQLDRVRRAVILREVLDEDAVVMQGRGSATEPLRVSRLPFGAGLTKVEAPLLEASELPPPCERARTDVGVVYEICLREESRVQAVLYAASGITGRAEIIHHSEDRCIAYGEEAADAVLAPGRHRVVFRFSGVGSGEADILMAIITL